MSKQLKLVYEGKNYTLEFTRRSIVEMEKAGFIIGEVEQKPMSTLPELFAGAFKAHHKFEKRETIDKIFDKITKKEELIGKLAEMYSEPILSLMDEPEKSEGNVDWTASF